MGGCASVRPLSDSEAGRRQQAYEIPCDIMSRIVECGDENDDDDHSSNLTAEESNQYVVHEEGDNRTYVTKNSKSNESCYLENDGKESDSDNRSILSLTKLVLSQRLLLSNDMSDRDLKRSKSGGGSLRTGVLSRDNSAGSSSIFSTVHSLISSLTSHSTVPSPSPSMSVDAYDEYMYNQHQMIKSRSLSSKNDKWANDLAEKYIVLPSGEVKLRKAKSSNSVMSAT